MLTDNTPQGLDLVAKLRSAVADVFMIEDTTLGHREGYTMRFRGQLLVNSVEAYRRVAERFRELAHTPLFRREGERDVILALKGAISPRPSPVWVNVVMFIATVVSALYTGAAMEPGVTDPLRQMDRGWPFAASIMAILLTHELGHYFAARKHKVAVTLPYFIPLPFPLSPFGTLGAFIQLKAPPTNRRALLDIGLAGPLAGFLVAVPILIVGLSLSDVKPIPAAVPPEGLGFEGNSLFYLATKFLVFGQLLPAPGNFGGVVPALYWLRYFFLGMPAPLGGHDVYLGQVAWAGWAGLLVTGLNLIPAGQLDGGHALYVLIGSRARKLLPVIISLLVLLGLAWSGWFLWAGLIFVFGRAYAEPLDLITRLDPGRKFLAIAGLVLFLLLFTPVPLRIFAP